MLLTLPNGQRHAPRGPTPARWDFVLCPRGLVSQHPAWKGASPPWKPPPRAPPLPSANKALRAVTSVQPVTLLSAAAGRPGGRPEVAPRCLLGEAGPCQARPAGSLLKWAGCASSQGVRSSHTPPKSAQWHRDSQARRTPCWAPPDNPAQETPTSEAPAPRVGGGGPPGMQGEGAGNMPSFLLEYITSSFS